jgi:hypothetical protein
MYATSTECSFAERKYAAHLSRTRECTRTECWYPWHASVAESAADRLHLTSQQASQPAGRSLTHRPPIASASTPRCHLWAVRIAHCTICSGDCRVKQRCLCFFGCSLCRLRRQLMHARGQRVVITMGMTETRWKWTLLSYHCQDVDKISLTLGLAFVLQLYLQWHNDSKVEPTVDLSQ